MFGCFRPSGWCRCWPEQTPSNLLSMLVAAANRVDCIPIHSSNTKAPTDSVPKRSHEDSSNAATNGHICTHHHAQRNKELVRNAVVKAHSHEASYRKPERHDLARNILCACGLPYRQAYHEVGTNPLEKYCQQSRVGLLLRDGNDEACLIIEGFGKIPHQVRPYETAHEVEDPADRPVP